MYVAFLCVVVAPVLITAFGFLLLLWNKPFVILAALWAIGTVALLTEMDGISDMVRLADLSAGLAICVVWLGAPWVKKHFAILRATPHRFGHHRPF